MRNSVQIWYKNAVIYSLDVESYYDSNGDGIGDFKGLAEKLEYISSLGVNCIWLLPFYPSPNRDNGYDVMDYYAIDSRLGSMGDFVQFLEKAEQLGLHVIIDLVVNHTSIQHPWFQQAIENKDSPYRDFYVWSDEPLEYEKEHLMLQGEEDTIWHFNEKAGQYYLHRFYKEQPDLNISNEQVKQEIIKIIDFWLRLGVSGFRIDAAEWLVEPYGLIGTDREQLLDFLNDVRDYVEVRKKDVLLLAEVNGNPGEMNTYLLHGERMHMLFNFYINQHLFLAFATANKSSLENALQSLPELHGTTQWLNFLRHHDELNLRLLSNEEREKVFQVFAPEQDMKIFGFGIRRRLAPIMEANAEKIKMAFSLLFSMPGAALIRYGDEIGMGDNLSLEGRASVRTPMQWSHSKNGGFSGTNIPLPTGVINSGPYTYEKVNVMTSHQDPNSLLNWLKQLISVRKQFPEIGTGKLFIVPHAYENILIHGFEHNGKKVLFIHNLANTYQEIPVELIPIDNNLVSEFFCQEKNLRNDNFLSLKAYAYKWFRIE